MKRIKYIVLMVILLVSIQAVPAAAASQMPELEGQAAIVMEPKTGEVLYEKSQDTLLEPASTTKVMTCLLALENLDPDKVVTVPKTKEKLTGNVMGLKAGEKIPVKSLLYGLMVQSANDAAVVLAEEMGGSVEGFCSMANQKAKELGAYNTTYVNPNGLNGAGTEKHRTTVRDMALITREAMKNKTFRTLVATEKCTIPATNKSKARTFKSTNLLLWDTSTKVQVGGINRSVKYAGAIGVKTGMTSTAGGCLIGAVSRDNEEFITVVFKSSANGRFSDTIKMFDWAYGNYEAYKVSGDNDILGKTQVKRGAVKTVGYEADGGAYVTVAKGSGPQTVSQKNHLYKNIKAPVKKGQQLGTADVYKDNKKIETVPLVATETVKKGGPLSIFGISDFMAMIVYIIAVIVVILIILLIIHNKRRKKRKLQARERQAMREAVKRHQKKEENV